MNSINVVLLLLLLLLLLLHVADDDVMYMSFAVFALQRRNCFSEIAIVLFASLSLSCMFQ